jgi:hypothetical protein
MLSDDKISPAQDGGEGGHFQVLLQHLPEGTSFKRTEMPTAASRSFRSRYYNWYFSLYHHFHTGSGAHQLSCPTEVKTA